MPGVCFPFLLPFMTRRDYSEGILAHLHSGEVLMLVVTFVDEASVVLYVCGIFSYFC
jgi:hypothetical protein